MKRKKIISTYSGLPKSIYILFIVRIINAMGAFVGPFLTMFLSDKIGMSKSTVGVFIMINSISTVPGSIIGGKICDMLGRKKILIIFQGIAALCYLPCAFLGSSMIIPYFLIFSSFLNSIAQPAYGAMIADLTNTKNRSNAYSLLYLGINIGFSVGPMIAGFLYSNYLQWIFIGNTITILITITIMHFFIQETIPKINDIDKTNLPTNQDENVEKGGLIKALLKRPILLSFAILSMVYSFVYAQYPYCIPLQVKDLFKNNASKIYGTLMAINGVTVILLTTFITKFTKRFSAIQNVAFSGLFFATGFGMLYFVRSYPLFILSTIIWTIGEILNSTNAGVYIANHTPISHRGRFNAVIPLISGTGFAVGPAIMGSYLKNRQVTAAWPITFICALSASILFYILYLTEKKLSQEPANNLSH